MGPKPDFNKIIQDGRERKANEKLANQIFSKNRRQSAPSKLKTPVTAPTLASRISKKPQRVSLGSRAITTPAPAKGNINGDWTHDLHSSVSTPNLSSRIANTNKKAATRRQNKFASALARVDSSADAAQQVSIKPAPAAANSFSIRGIAGPFCVMAQNFARGTTAADVESAMTPVGGPMESCKIVKTEPFILVEMLFASKECGERVIETFNNQTADGKVIKVWAKIGGPSAPPTGPRAQRNDRSNNSGNKNSDQFVDGTLGFADPMERDQRGLYSDKMVSGGSGRGGRGHGRGRR